MVLPNRHLAAAVAYALVGMTWLPASAQRAGAPALMVAPSTGIKLEVIDGSTATYRVREQLAGINFPSDAVGTANAVSGTLVIKADGSIDSAQSKLTVDLRTLRSDQNQRDRFIQGGQVLNTETFPLAEFVPKRAVGMPWPFPATQPPQAGFQLVGDMTIHGTTSEVTWNIIATFNGEQVAGHASTEFTFAKFGVPKPQLARLLSVDDKVGLEMELKFKRTPM